MNGSGGGGTRSIPNVLGKLFEISLNIYTKTYDSVTIPVQCSNIYNIINIVRFSFCFPVSRRKWKPPSSSGSGSGREVQGKSMKTVIFFFCVSFCLYDDSWSPTKSLYCTCRRPHYSNENRLIRDNRVRLNSAD